MCNCVYTRCVIVVMLQRHGRREPLGGSGKSEDEQKEEDTEKDGDSSPKSPKSSKDSPTPEGMYVASCHLGKIGS